MKSIWKFKLDWKFVPDQRSMKVMMPVGAKLLTAQGQNDQIFLWAEIDTSAEKEEVIFEVFGTGHEIPEDMGTGREYVGTVQMYGGTYVFHIYKWTGI